MHTFGIYYFSGETIRPLLAFEVATDEKSAMALYKTSNPDHEVMCAWNNDPFFKNSKIVYHETYKHNKVIPKMGLGR